MSVARHDRSGCKGTCSQNRIVKYRTLISTMCIYTISARNYPSICVCIIFTYNVANSTHIWKINNLLSTSKPEPLAVVNAP